MSNGNGKPMVDDVVAAYIQLRDAKELLAKKQADEMKPLVERMKKIEGWLQAALIATGVDSFKTERGTAFIQTNVSTTVRDWTATLDWIKANNEWSLLTAAVSKTAIKDYKEQYHDVPPGVDYREEVVVRVRRPTN